jgi:hypothetical protein
MLHRDIYDQRCVAVNTYKTYGKIQVLLRLITFMQYSNQYRKTSHLKTVRLRSPLLWDVTLWQWVIGFQRGGARGVFFFTGRYVLEHAVVTLRGILL